MSLRGQGRDDLIYVWSQETQVMTTLRDAPHQHESRFGHKVLATSTVCEQSKPECSIIDQRPNIIGAGHDVKKSTASVQKSLQRPTTCRPSQRGHSYSWIIQRKESDGSQTHKSGLSNRWFDEGTPTQKWIRVTLSALTHAFLGTLTMTFGECI